MRHEDIPEINNPKIRFPKLEGDKLMKEVLNGGYNVHPVQTYNTKAQENRSGVSKNHPAYRELVDHWEETAAGRY